MGEETWAIVNGVGAIVVGILVVWIEDRAARIGLLPPLILCAMNFGAELSRLGVFR